MNQQKQSQIVLKHGRKPSKLRLVFPVLQLPKWLSNLVTAWSQLLLLERHSIFVGGFQPFVFGWQRGFQEVLKFSGGGHSNAQD
ncbi:Uncharacterised protein [Streptococcus pneumoniae]|nr:Uncharacterised protein [Streptococcus pneumoniae]